MTPKEAYDIVKAKHKNARITRMVDYDDSSYVLTVIDKEMEGKILDPYIKVDKGSGYLSNFLPTAHAKEWMNAIQNRTIDLDKLKGGGSDETKRN